MTARAKVIDAIIWHINYLLKGMGEMYVINAGICYVGISYDNKADLSFLDKLGIKVPPHSEQKHWACGQSDFAFFVTKSIFEKVCEDYQSNTHS